MKCLICGGESGDNRGAICNPCISDISAACPLVWLRGRPGLPLIDILLMDALASRERFTSPPPFKSYIKEAENEKDDLKIEGIVSHLAPLPPVSDGDMELLEMAIHLAEGSISGGLSEKVISLLKASRSRAPDDLSSSEIDNIIAMIGRQTPGGDEPLPPAGKRKEEPKSPSGDQRPQRGSQEDIHSMLVMAQMEALSGNIDTAIDLCDKILSLDPDNVDAMLIMSYALTGISPEDAIGFAEDAMSLEDSPRTRFAHAYALYRGGEPWGKVVQDLLASKVWEEHVQAWHVLLGEAYLKGGRKDRAIEEFRSALQHGDERTSLIRLRDLGVLNVSSERVNGAQDALRGVTWVKV